MRVSSRTLLIAVACCAGLFGVILALAYLSPAARELDAQALHSSLGLVTYGPLLLMDKTRQLADPAAVGVQVALLASIALLRGRPRLALAVVGLLAVTSVSSQVLKAVLAYPRFESTQGFAELPPASFPSGHATAAMSLAIAGVLVVPARLRPLAAVVGCGLALAMGFSLVSLRSHFPSDVAGGFLLAAGWGLVVELALRLADERWPERTVRGRVADAVRAGTDAAAAAGLATVVGMGVVLLVLAGLVVALTHPGAVVDLARDHTLALLMASALAALAAALLGGITLAIRRRG